MGAMRGRHRGLCIVGAMLGARTTAPAHQGAGGGRPKVWQPRGGPIYPRGRPLPHLCASHTFAPISTEVDSILTKLESLPAPLWGTFCGGAAGVWDGRYAAFDAVKADAQPLAFAEDGDKRRKVLDLATRCVESRGTTSTGPLLRRMVAKALSPERVVEVTAPLLSLDLLADEEGVASVIGRSEGSLQLEDMGPDEPGLVWFEDGSFSRGPISLAPEEVGEDQAQRGAAEGGAASIRSAGGDDDDDEDEAGPLPATVQAALEAERLAGEEPTKVFMMELCICQGAKSRVRLQCLVRSWWDDEAGEMAVELLRTSLFAETWTGSAASEAPEGRPWGGAEGTPLSAASRLRMDDARGAWSVFEVEATPTANADAAAAGVQQAAFSYSSVETRQLWGVGDLSDSAGDLEGVCFVLPGPCFLSLEMVGPKARPTGSDARQPRGLLLKFGWEISRGQMRTMERVYGPDGELVEVRAGSCVKGSWVGGRM